MVSRQYSSIDIIHYILPFIDKDNKDASYFHLLTLKNLQMVHHTRTIFYFVNFIIDRLSFIYRILISFTTCMLLTPRIKCWQSVGFLYFTSFSRLLKIRELVWLVKTGNLLFRKLKIWQSENLGRFKIWVSNNLGISKSAKNLKV